MNYLLQLIERSQAELFSKGVKFQDYTLISSISIGAYIVALAINGTLGVKTGKTTSDKYKLVITPPPWAFSIWGIIFTTTLIALLWSIHTVSWSLKTHLYFWLYCLTISAWILLWAMATKLTVFFSSLASILLTLSIFLIWESTLRVEDDSYGTILMRTTLAFQLGWTASAQCLNFCIILVYVFGLSQEAITKIVWVLLSITHSTYFYLANKVCRENNNIIILNFGGYILSASWAIIGVLISQLQYEKGKRE